MDRPRVIEFGVEMVSRANQIILVVGRCHRGPIIVDDVFDCVYQLLPQKTAGGYGPSRRTGDRPTVLQVREIRAYGHSLDTLDEGLTAELALIGDEGVPIEPLDVLGWAKK